MKKRTNPVLWIVVALMVLWLLVGLAAQSRGAPLPFQEVALDLWPGESAQINVSCAEGDPCPTCPACPTPEPTNTPEPAPTDAPTATLPPVPTDTPPVPTDTPAPPVPTDTPEPTVPPGGDAEFVGIAGVPPSAFAAVANFHALAISAPSHMDAPDLEAFLTDAKAQGLTVLGRAKGRSAFTDGKQFDYEGLRQMVEEVFGGNDIAGDAAFIGYYIVDEPCHPDKFDLTPDEMRQFYATVKGVDSRIPVLVNFGYLECAQSFVGGGSFTDIATFTITPKKARDAAYLPRQVAAAQALKAEYPDMAIVPWLAVYEYPRVGQALPSAEWVRDTGLETIAAFPFDGIMYYPWSPSSYMGDTIEDVAGDPEYIEAFRAVFQ